MEEDAASANFKCHMFLIVGREEAFDGLEKGIRLGVPLSHMEWFGG